MRFFAQEMMGGEDHAGGADAALRAAAIEKGLLQVLQAAIVRQTFDSDDASAVCLKDGNQAAIYERPVD